MKMSAVGVSDIKQYANIYFNDDDNMLASILVAGKAFIAGYTGLPLTSDTPNIDTCDKHEDLSVALMVLCNEMYSTRNFIVEANKVNFVVKSILDIYAVNYL